MLAMAFDLAAKPCQDVLAQAVWSNEQFIIRRFMRITSQGVAQVDAILTNCRAR
jgi:hypothetical protein